METLKHFLVRILVVFISLSCINGAGSLLIDRQDINILTGHNHPGDIESTHHHHSLLSHDEEKILECCSFDFSFSYTACEKFLNNLNFTTQDFSFSVWQPPRFI
jgi:hypothetical protein